MFPPPVFLRLLPPPPPPPLFPLTNAESNAAAVGLGGSPGAAGNVEPSMPGANPPMRSPSRLAVVDSSRRGAIDGGGG